MIDDLCAAMERMLDLLAEPAGVQVSVAEQLSEANFPDALVGPVEVMMDD